jgi:hypothetical protein
MLREQTWVGTKGTAQNVQSRSNVCDTRPDHCRIGAGRRGQGTAPRARRRNKDLERRKGVLLYRRVEPGILRLHAEHEGRHCPAGTHSRQWSRESQKKLTDLDDSGYNYSIVESPLSIANHIGKIWIEKDAQPGENRLRWEVSFDVNGNEAVTTETTAAVSISTSSAATRCVIPLPPWR